jgi:hypothetical protein
MRPWLPGTPENHPAGWRADKCPAVSTVMAAIGQFERTLIGDHILSGLEREVRG